MDSLFNVLGALEHAITKAVGSDWPPEVSKWFSSTSDEAAALVGKLERLEREKALGPKPVAFSGNTEDKAARRARGR